MKSGRSIDKGATLEAIMVASARDDESLRRSCSRDEKEEKDSREI